MTPIERATVFARGIALPRVLKSAFFSICMPPMLRIGSRISASRITPIPPVQVTSPRQSRTPGGMPSSPTITVAPVAVMAETISK